MLANIAKIIAVPMLGITGNRGAAITQFERQLQVLRLSADLIRRNSFRLAGPIAASLALGGCGQSITYADLPAANIPVPEQWSAGAAPLETDVTDYWLALNDPALAEFVALAAENNLDLAQSAARLAQAREALVIARAGRVPAISASGGVSREVGDFAERSLQFSVGADASWEADLFGQITGSVDAASADLASAGYSLADLQRIIIGNVAVSTISARSTAAQLAIARDTLVNQDDNLQIARWRNQAGLVSSLDVEQARVQRAQTAASIPALESDLAATANAISTLIGEPPGRVLALLDNTAPIPRPPETVGLAAPAEVLRRRPDVRAAEAGLLASSARVGVARAQLLPLVRLTGTVGSGSIGIGNLFDIITGNLFAGVSQLIFDGGRTRAQVGSAEAAAEGALAAWRQSILIALEDVESGSASLSAARQRVALFAEAREAAENAAILARSQYQAGLTDFRTLLTAENQLLSARNSQVASEAQRASAFVTLTQALGGGWDPGNYPETFSPGLDP